MRNCHNFDYDLHIKREATEENYDDEHEEETAERELKPLNKLEN